MRIIFIRHGDPNYEKDCLTEKGVREAKLLAKRVAKWENITQFYCSPLGRAKETASYSLEAVGREAITYEWMKEFVYFIDDPVTGRHGVPWDLMPAYWTEIPEMYDKEGWKQTALYRSNDELLPAYDGVCKGLDELLSSYGYTRHHNYYLTDRRQCGRYHRDLLPSGRHLHHVKPSSGHLPGASPAWVLPRAHLRHHPCKRGADGRQRHLPCAGDGRCDPPSHRR